MEKSVIGSFTSIGPAVRSKLFDWADLSDYSMDGKTVLITGSSSGIGLATARRLASMGARVIVTSRDPLRAEEARQKVAKVAGAAGTAARTVDLSDLDSVRRLAIELDETEPRLDVLVHNAGALLDSFLKSEQDVEMTFATMVLGPFALTNALMPMLTRTDGRVIFVSSGGMYTQPLKPFPIESPDNFSGTAAYAQAKRAHVVLAEMFAERLRQDHVTVHSMHPGWADTPGVQSTLPRFHRLLKPLLRTPEQGADTIAWLASCPQASMTTGQFWLDRQPRKTHRLARTKESPGERESLWTLLEGLSTQ